MGILWRLVFGLLLNVAPCLERKMGVCILQMPPMGGLRPARLRASSFANEGASTMRLKGFRVMEEAPDSVGS